MNIVVWIIIGILILVGLYFFNKWNQKPVEWNPQEVADLLQTWIDEDIDYRGWDYFEACEIANSKLEIIRQEALSATYLKSPYIESCGESGERLNEQGKEKFKGLKAKCLELA